MGKQMPERGPRSSATVELVGVDGVPSLFDVFLYIMLLFLYEFCFIEFVDFLLMYLLTH